MFVESEALFVVVLPPPFGDLGCALRHRPTFVLRSFGVTEHSPRSWRNIPGLDVRTHFRYIGGGVGLVKNAREKNEARAVAEISAFI